MNRSKPLKPKRRKGPTAAEKRYWDSLPLVCQGCDLRGTSDQGIVIHHVLAEAQGKRGRRDNMLVNRLCPFCHNMNTDSVHLLGSEAKFKEVHGIDLVAIAVRHRDTWLATVISPSRGIP